MPLLGRAFDDRYQMTIDWRCGNIYNAELPRWGTMIDKVQVIFVLLGIGLLVGAGILGFGHGNWVPSLALAGVGSGAFIFGVQHDIYD